MMRNVAYDNELPTILRNVDLERIARGEGCQGDWLCDSEG